MIIEGLITVKLPYSVIRSLTPLPMKDKGTNGSDMSVRPVGSPLVKAV